MVCYNKEDAREAYPTQSHRHRSFRRYFFMRIFLFLFPVFADRERANYRKRRSAIFDDVAGVKQLRAGGICRESSP